MPSSILAIESVLMTDCGWVNVGAAQSDSLVLGSDRHGKISPRRVAIKLTEKTGPVAVVGTEAAFGTFPSKAKLMMQTGQPISTSSIVEESNLDGLSFETVVQLQPSLTSKVVFQSFAIAMRRSAVFSSRTRFARRCRSRDVLDWKPKVVTKFCTFQKESQEVFCIVHEDNLAKVETQDWFEVVHGVAKVLSYNSEEKAHEFDLHDCGFGLWYLSALVRLGTKYRLAYDSLQHSLFVTVHEVQDHQTPFAQARCAYYSELNGSWRIIEWQDRSWAPIVNGFLIAPS